MKLKYIFCLLVALNSGLIFGASSNKKYYDETSENLSRERYPNTANLNKALDGAEVFDCLEGDSIVAKMYLITRVMRLPIEDFELIFKKHQDLLLKTLFGRSVILGWMVHFYDEPGQLFQFNKETHSYDALFVAMGKKTGATSVVGQLTPLFDAAKFYTHSVWLSSASKELASSGYKPYNYPIEEAFDAALKKGNSHEESSLIPPVKPQSFLKRNAWFIGCGISIATIVGFILYFWKNSTTTS
jgi:hypothetical protein